MTRHLITLVAYFCALSAAMANAQTKLSSLVFKWYDGTSSKSEEFQAAGKILTKDKCSVLDTTRSDGESGIFYLSKPIEASRGRMFEVTGVGTIQKVGAKVDISENVGVMYVIGEVHKANETNLVIQWEGGSGGPQNLDIHVTEASKVCRQNATYSVNKLRPGDKITAKVRTSGTPKNTLIKAVVGERTIKLRPFFQLHTVFLGEDFYEGKDSSCD